VTTLVCATTVLYTARYHRRIRDLVDEYAGPPLGFVDTSVVAVAERLELDTVATLHREHFPVVRPQHVEAFALVP
jgi:predicted nucleic acid-binding protein